MSWTNLSGGALDLVSSGVVNSLTSIGDTLYAGGTDQTTPQDRPFVMSYDSSNQIWTNLSGGDLDVVSSGNVRTLTSIGDTLYAGGLDNTNNSFRTFVMSYDGFAKRWTKLSGGDLDLVERGYVNSLTSIGDTLYAGGSDQTNGLKLFVMSYNGSTWTKLSGGDLDMINGQVSSLTSIGDTLYAGGTDQTYTPFVMSYDGFAQRWTNLSGGDFDFNGIVNSLTSIGNTLYAGGYNNDTDIPFVMSYDSSNQVWTNLSGGNFVVDDYIYSLTAIGNTLYVGGENDGDTRLIIIKSYDRISQVWTNLRGGDLARISEGAINSLSSIGNTLYAGGGTFNPTTPFVMSYGSQEPQPQTSFPSRLEGYYYASPSTIVFRYATVQSFLKGYRRIGTQTLSIPDGTPLQYTGRNVTTFGRNNLKTYTFNEVQAGGVAGYVCVWSANGIAPSSL